MAEPVQTPPRRGRAALAFLVFSLGAVVLTYPVAWSLSEGLAGDGADANLFVWNHWWFERAVEEGRNPYHTDVIYWPTGTSLVLHTFSPFHGALALGLAPVMGHVAAYNVLVLLDFALAAWAMWLLARDLTGSEPAAYAAGFAFGFAGYHYAHALGHLNLVAYHWLPLFVLFFLRYARTARLRHALLAALMLVGAAFTDYALLLTVALGALALSLATFGVRSFDGWARPLVPGLMAGILVSPLIAMVLREYLTAPELRSFGDEAGRYSLDAFSYVVPTPLSTLYADVGRVLPKDGTTTEATLFLGYLALALAAYGVAKTPWRRTRPWVLTAGAFYLLSLGPQLQVFGHQTGVPMPYALLRHLPLVDTLRTPARFGLIVLLCAAVLAAFGVAALLARLAEPLARRAPRRLAAPALVALLCAVILAESVVVPFPVTPVRTGTLYEEAKAVETKALVELPLHQPGYAGQLGRVNYLAAQTQHGIPLVNGYNARETGRDTVTLQGQQVLGLFHRLELGTVPLDEGDVFPEQDARDHAGDLLARRGMNALILHRSDPMTEAERRDAELLATLPGVRVVHDTPRGTLYRAVASETPPPVLLDLAQDWHGLELLDGTPTRWSYQSPAVLVHAAEPMQARLSFNVTPFLGGGLEARTLRLVVEGQVVLEQALGGGWTRIEAEVALNEGTNHVVLHSVQPAVSPRQVFAGADSRPLAWYVQDVRVTPLGQSG